MRLILTFSLLCLSPSASPAGDITFNKQIAPIIWKNCAGCHRPGEVAPFSLLSYRDVSKRAEQVRDITARHAMPPWKPVSGQGEFSNGRRLSKEEIELIRNWVAGGSKEGAAADLPSPPTFATGWQLGTPDLTITLPEPINVPSEGRDVYLNVVLPLSIPTGKYIKAAEFRPSNRRVVHHAVLFCDTSGESRKRDEAEPGPGFRAITPPARLLPGAIAIWVPGRFPVRLPEGIALPWPVNADLVLNLHLHPSGKPEVEQSTIGLYLTNDAPQRQLMNVTLQDKQIDIPPGEKSFRTRDSKELPVDADLLSVFPHMHMIGKDIKVTAIAPDGTSRTLLWIDDWDFNWQDLYQYAAPIRLAKGTRVVLEGTHDNSADNPRNPRTPPERVRYGEQTFDEMSIAFLELVPVGSNGANSAKPAAAQPRPEEIAARAKEALARFDADGDGKLSLGEIVAAVNHREPVAELEKRIAPFDRDRDKHLNLAEVTEALKALGGGR